MPSTIKLRDIVELPLRRWCVMQSWVIAWVVFCAVGLALPVFLLVLAWRRHSAAISVLIVPVIAVAILAFAMDHDIRWVLLGADYTRRLFATIGIFVVLTLVNAVYAAIRRAWSVAAASALICAAWFFVGVVNSSM